jgi:hypothetical protein
MVREANRDTMRVKKDVEKAAEKTK